MKPSRIKQLRRLVFGIMGLLVALVIYGLLQLKEPVAISTPTNTSPQFSGKALLVTSDADMVATAYADAKLDRVAGIEDTLTTISLPLEPDRPEMGTAPVSNSVMSWPQIIAVSPDGNRAYVVEVRSHPPKGIQEYETIDQMPEGSRLTVINIANPAQPKVVETTSLGRNPEHITISPNGQYLAINLVDPGRELLIIQLNSDGSIGQRSYFPMATDGTRMDNRTAIWHPSGQFLAMTQDHNRRIGFYRVENKGGQLSVTAEGEPLTVGNHLSHPRFTTDGRFLLVPDLKWSTYPIQALGFLLNPKGEMIAVHFEPGQTPEVLSRVAVGLSPEGFALSPDNSLLATVNMRRTYLSPTFPPVWRGKTYSSVSLVQFDTQSGQLKTLDEYGFEGLLPEQATFDAEGNALAIVIFNYREQGPKTGAVEFWNVYSQRQQKLERTGYKIEVTRGPHDMIVSQIMVLGTKLL